MGASGAVRHPLFFSSLLLTPAHRVKPLSVSPNLHLSVRITDEHLVDCLAMRKDVGELKGEVLVNGKELPISFQRTTGYVEQMDVHQPEATVREALEFSALLRQPRTLSDEDKLEYVDVIIDLRKFPSTQ